MSASEFGSHELTEGRAIRRTVVRERLQHPPVSGDDPRDVIAAQRRGAVGGESEMALAQLDVLIGTGVRVGELLAIAPDTDIDLQRRTLTISRQLIYLPGDGFVFAPPKTDDSGRR